MAATGIHLDRADGCQGSECSTHAYLKEPLSALRVLSEPGPMPVGKPRSECLTATRQSDLKLQHKCATKK